jgi:hypothetical protein
MDELIRNLGPNPGKISFPVIKEALEKSLLCSDLTGYRESIRKYFFKALCNADTNSTDIKDTITPTTTSNHIEQLDSIFITLKENIENGYTMYQIKHALRKGMDNLGSEFPGRWTMIEKYAKSKKNEIENIRVSKKLWETEVIKIFNLICTKLQFFVYILG